VGSGRRARQRRAVVPFLVVATLFLVVTAFFLVVTAFFLVVTAFFFTVVGFLADAVFRLDEDFFALAFDFVDFDRAVTFDFALRDARAERDDRERLRADRERVYTGRFQPTARSARNEAGMLRMPSCESVTASAAASARSARTSLIT
jgi:hypothetical protein